MSTHVTTNESAFGIDTPPVYDGPDTEAYRVITPGVYPAYSIYYGDTADYIESGHIIVYGPHESTKWISAGFTPGTSGSFFMPESCNMMGCPTRDPHYHTIQELTGEEWWTRKSPND